LDFEKLKQWQDFARKAGGGDFWSNVFNDQWTKEALKEMSKTFFSEAPFPRTDVYMDGGNMIVVMEIPGVRKEDLQVAVHGDRLTVSGVVTQPYTAHAAVNKERSYGPFERTIQLPETAARENALARYENGILEVRLPRTHQGQTSKINIE